LREIIAYDYKFPVERRELDHQLAYLEGLTAEQLRVAMRVFANLGVTAELEAVDWVNAPADFSEQLTAHLWRTHQIDTFRAAAVEYVEKLNASQKQPKSPTHRLTVVAIGLGVAATNFAPFRKLQPHGVHYKAVDGRDGSRTIFKTLTERAIRFPEAFGHWHIDGGAIESPPAGLTCISYHSLKPIRAQLQTQIQKAYESGTGSEALRTALARIRPEAVGLEGSGDRAVLNHFQLSLLTEGSGTQIFSTTFIQWAAREILRRAQPSTLSARFTPRQREDSSQAMLLESRRDPPLDPEGSLIDADMGAYYTWLNQQRLTGASDARFLVWFEDHNEALAIAPNLPKGTRSTEKLSLEHLLNGLA
jgi:hypothetical protein